MATVLLGLCVDLEFSLYLCVLMDVAPTGAATEEPTAGRLDTGADEFEGAGTDEESKKAAFFEIHVRHPWEDNQHSELHRCLKVGWQGSGIQKAEEEQGAKLTFGSLPCGGRPLDA
jgi:hypothetical protein